MLCLIKDCPQLDERNNFDFGLAIIQSMTVSKITTFLHDCEKADKEAKKQKKKAINEVDGVSFYRDSRVYGYFQVRLHSLSAVFMEKYHVSIDQINNFDIPTVLLRVVFKLKEIKDVNDKNDQNVETNNIISMRSAVKKCNIMNQTKGYLRLSRVAKDEMVFHIMIQGKKYWKCMSDIRDEVRRRNGVMSAYTITHGGEFENFHVLSPSPSHESHPCVLSMFSDSNLEIDPCFRRHIGSFQHGEFILHRDSSRSSKSSRVTAISHRVAMVVDRYQFDGFYTISKSRELLNDDLEQEYGLLHEQLRKDKFNCKDDGSSDDDDEKASKLEIPHNNNNEIINIENDTKSTFQPFYDFSNENEKPTSKPNERYNKPFVSDEVKNVEEENNGNKQSEQTIIVLTFGASAAKLELTSKKLQKFELLKKYDQKLNHQKLEEAKLNDKRKNITIQLKIPKSGITVESFKLFGTIIDHDKDTDLSQLRSTVLGHLYLIASYLQGKEVMKNIVQAIADKFNATPLEEKILF